MPWMPGTSRRSGRTARSRPPRRPRSAISACAAGRSPNSASLSSSSVAHASRARGARTSASSSNISSSSGTSRRSARRIRAGPGSPAGAALTSRPGRAARGRPRRSWSAPHRARRPPPRSPSPPPASRSSTLMTPQIRVSGLLQRRDRRERRAARGDHVLDHHAALVRVERRALDPTLQTVRLRSLRTKNAFAWAPPASAAQATGSAPIVMPPTAVALPVCDLGGDERGQRREAARQQDRALGIDVVLRSARRSSASPRRSRARARAARR